ncbi:uncharacterized protein LOC135073066 [Ostrinia nubilalis]|uniref:uncharacterized protein LOC114351746 n=1 Tax=Ostrinia furnacalis TaxID=93504 RepID=UPI00103B6A63|nr:uncharacterized protein LOC114351746 [Ostrinia furnacalis]
MASVGSRIFELFRSLKSDAVPKPPRPAEDTESRGAKPNITTEDSKEPVENEDEHEEIIFEEDDFIKTEKKTKFRSPFKSKKGKDDHKDPKPEDHDKRGSFSSVNTQATGTVFNVVNATGVQFGSNYTYYMSATNGNTEKSEKKGYTGDNIEKDNLIILLMESKIEPTHKYIDFISKNLGTNWKSFFGSLGYLIGRIDTLQMEKGITEARYKLLKDWVDNDDDGSLGRLASLLWDEGERQIVRELSIIYKENKK